MSLVAHWTFNDDNGIDQVQGLTPKAGTPSFVDGKLGRAMSGGNYQYSYQDYINLQYDVSYSFWLYVTSLPASRCGIMQTQYGAEIALNITSGGDFQWYYGTSGAQASPYTQWTIGSTWNVVTVGEWHHYVLQRNSKTNRLYCWKDGVLEDQTTQAYETVAEATGNTLYLGYSYTGNLLGYLDDVRIYDHVLSTREIQELSRAKVLHYTFDDFQEPTTNYLIAGTGDTGALDPARWAGTTLVDVGTSILDTPIFQYDTAGTSYTYTVDSILDDDLATLSGQTVTFSLYLRRVEGDATGRIRVYDNVNGYYYKSVDVTTQFQRFTATRTMGSGATRMFVMIDNTGGGTYEFHSPQLEEKSYATPFYNGTGSRSAIVRDSSGQGNDSNALTETYTPEWTEDSKIGSGAYNFGTSTEEKYIEVPDDNLVLTEAITVMAWAKPSETVGSHNIVSHRPGNQGWIIHNTATNLLRVYVYVGTSWYNATSSSPVYSIGEWVHIVLTYDGETLRGYADGVEVCSTTSPSGPITHPDGNIRIGGSSEPTIDQHWHGEIDDVRIYSTALSADDIKEIYQVRASIDNRGNLWVS